MKKFLNLRRFSLLFLLGVGFYLLVSCSSSPEKKLLGKWQGSEASLKANDSLPLNSSTWREGLNAHKHTFYTFKEDKTFNLVTEYKRIFRNTSGTWSLSKDGKDLTLVMPEYAMTNQVKLVAINSKQLTWIMSYPFGELSTTFVKVR